MCNHGLPPRKNRLRNNREASNNHRTSYKDGNDDNEGDSRYYQSHDNQYYVECHNDGHPRGQFALPKPSRPQNNLA